MLSVSRDTEYRTHLSWVVICRYNKRKRGVGEGYFFFFFFFFLGGLSGFVRRMLRFLNVFPSGLFLR